MRNATGNDIDGYEILGGDTAFDNEEFLGSGGHVGGIVDLVGRS